MTLTELRTMLDSGTFHHATYRDIGKLWEGLFIYAIAEDDLWIGYRLAGSFGKDDPDLAAAEDMVRHTGISVGAFGQG
jgi:hypothetical protein